MWDLDDWKDAAEVVKNFADTALALVGALALLKWEWRNAKAAPPPEDGKKARTSD